MVEKALDETLADLGVGYLDLWHMHWPVASKDGKSYNDYVKVCPSATGPADDCS